MSKIGKTPIDIEEGATITIADRVVTVQGPKGTLDFRFSPLLDVKVTDGKIIVSVVGKEETARAMFGLTRALIANMVKGVTKGFEKKLELVGVGYRAQVSGVNLTLSVGFSHPVIIKPEEGILFTVAENVITVAGINKEIVGNTAAKIRSIRPPEPYKGKGIKYVGEKIRRKAGKAAKAVGAK